MGESLDQSPGDGEKREPEATKPIESSAAEPSGDGPQPQAGDDEPQPQAGNDGPQPQAGNDGPQPQAGNEEPPWVEASEDTPSDLPWLEAPQLDAADPAAAPQPEAVNDRESELATVTNVESTAPAPATPARSSRFPLLAATIALAAALGAFLGSVTTSGIARLFAQAPAISKTADVKTADIRTADVRDLMQALKAELGELAALKASLEGATRNANTQFAKIAERLDGIEHAELDPAAKLAHVAETLDRIEKRQAAAPETTASITAAAAAVSTSAAAPAAPPASEPNAGERVLDGWIVQDVRNGRALVESRYGGVFIVSAGSVIPGLGRVEAVKRQDGEWVVVTARGLITSRR